MMIDSSEIEEMYCQLQKARVRLSSARVVLGAWKEKAYAEYPELLKHAQTIEARELTIAAIFQEEKEFATARAKFTEAELDFQLYEDEIDRIKTLIAFGVRCGA